MSETKMPNDVMGKGMEIGLYSFGERLPDLRTGKVKDARERLAEMIQAAKLADAAGLDVFAVGEHHRPDMAVSAAPVVLGAMAQATERIRLASAVTVLSTSDPVLVFEEFATVDLISNGRAEIIAGRGAFVESFPLFGYDLKDYDALFAEKIELLLQLNETERVTWNGHFRAALSEAEISPRPAQGKLPIWIGVGGTPQSAVRAGMLGTPMMLAIIGGAPAQFKPLVELYRHTGTEAGHAMSELKVGVSSHFHVQKDSQKAREEFYPYYANYFGVISRSRGREIQVTRSDFEQLASLRGALFVGSPQEIIDKLMYQYEVFKHQRFMGQFDIGGLPFAKATAAIELLAAEVAPVVRRETARAESGKG